MSGEDWMKEEAELNWLTPLGQAYPAQVIATVYEVNGLGEKRLVEQKVFQLVEVKS